MDPTLELDQETTALVSEVTDHFINDRADAAEQVLREVVRRLAANTAIKRLATVRVEISCRGCGKHLLKATDQTEVRAGASAPTLVLSAGLDPHTCIKTRRGLF